MLLVIPLVCIKPYRMKKLVLCVLIGIAAHISYGQSPAKDNTLLWRISGKNLSKPSYLFGTIHMLCADDIQLSDSLKGAIAKTDRVYLELDMDNLAEMMSVLQKMKMQNDTTLSDLLSTNEYQQVKTFFKDHSSSIPFSILETYKPLLASSLLMQGTVTCSNPIAMEQLIMADAKAEGKQIKGLETMAFQLSIFDSIPYSKQAKQLVKYVQTYNDQKDSVDFEELTRAYKQQDLKKLEEITSRDDMGIDNFASLLLYNRNINWVGQLENLMSDESLTVAVGAGHLVGEKGLISLLRKKGYVVEPVANNMLRDISRRL
jgi:uncharacterized protein YbaP (TraB family)